MNQESRCRTFGGRFGQSPSGPVDPSFRALSGRLKFTVRRHKFNKGFLSSLPHSGLLADFSQVDMLGVWYKPVNFGARKYAVSRQIGRIEVEAGNLIGKEFQS